jgi:transcriptional regulator
MYVTPRSREQRIDVLHAAVAALRIGTLVTLSGGELRATHVPMMIRPNPGANGTLVGHVARANPQWQDHDTTIPGIATFLGPNFYVRPSWYATKATSGAVVPTWNYLAVEARGPVRFFHECDALRQLVGELTDVHEAPRAKPWSIDDAPPDYIEAMLNAIVGFEMPIASLEGAWKLGQHKNADDRAGVAAGITAETNDPAILDLVPLVAAGAMPVAARFGALDNRR